MSWEVRTDPASFDQPETHTRSYEWKYENHTFTWTMELPASLYDCRKRRHRIYDYGAYIGDSVTRELFESFCDSLRAESRSNGFGRTETVEFVASFVQSLPYTPDTVSTDYSNYPRYPIETLVDQTGDCEDTSILLAALLNGLGYRVGLLEFESHLGVGVVVDRAPDNIAFDGIDYTYIEATDSSWDIGKVPERYRGESVTLHSAGDSPVLYTGWRGETHGNRLHCGGSVLNYGTGPAEDVLFQLTLTDQQDQTVAGIEQQWNRIGPGEELDWQDSCHVDPDQRLQPEWVLAIDQVVHDRGTRRRQSV